MYIYMFRAMGKCCADGYILGCVGFGLEHKLNVVSDLKKKTQILVVLSARASNISMGLRKEVMPRSLCAAVAYSYFTVFIYIYIVNTCICTCTCIFAQIISTSS